MPKEEEYVRELQKVTELKYHCRAAHTQTVFVREESAENCIVWCGEVEVFHLTGHKSAKRCFAWQDIDHDGIKIFTVLENRWINSAQRAVQAAIFMDVQQPVAKPVTDLELLKKRIRAAKNAIYRAEINGEDLEAIIQTSVSIQKRRKQNRSPLP